MRMTLGAWLHLIRPGDVLVALAGLAVCVQTVLLLWQGDAVILHGGDEFNS